ncbi:MAG: hypothetical protein AAFN40_14880 [Cyanobacteria bacterium J06560_6]
MNSLVKTSNVVIIDNDRDRAKGMVQAFENADCATPIHLWKNGRGKTQYSANKEIPKHCTVLLWHVGDLGGYWADITADQLVYYSGNGGNDSRFPAETAERIWRPVKIGAATSGSGILSSAEAQALLVYVSKKTVGSRDLEKPAFLERGDHALAALAMLCQGYLAAYAQYDEPTNRWEPQDFVGILCDTGWASFLRARRQTTWFEEGVINRKQVITKSASWWLKGLGLLSPAGDLDSSAYSALLVTIEQAWMPSEPDADLLLFLSTISKQNLDNVSVDNSWITPEVVAGIYTSIQREISKSSIGKFSDLTYRFSIPEEDFKHIMTMQTDALSTATATVLALLLDAELHLMDRKQLPTSIDLDGPSLLITAENALDGLSALRLCGFSGAVIAFSPDSFEQVKQRHPIMRWGQGSHGICSATSTVACLLAQIANMYPLEPENLAMLQNQLTAPVTWLDEKIVPLLNTLQESDENRQQHINELATFIQDLREITPVVYHTIADVGGQEIQIQHHFRDKLDKIMSEPSPKKESCALLRQVFEQWRDLVLALGGNPQ